MFDLVAPEKEVQTGTENPEQSPASNLKWKILLALSIVVVITASFLIHEYEHRNKYPDLSTDGVLYKGKQAWEAADYAESFDYYDEACRRGSQLGCYDYALHFTNGAGVTKDPQHGLNLMLENCEDGSGYANACNYAGAMLANGAGVKKDVDRAWKLLDSVCAMDNVVTCESARTLIRENGNLTSFVTAEAEMHRKLEIDSSTYNLQAYLLRFPESRYADRVRERLSSEAQNHFKKAVAAANNLNVVEAEKEFIESCQDGSGISCASVGDIYLVESRVSENPQAYAGTFLPFTPLAMVIPVSALVRFDVARVYYKWGCEGGYGYGCLRLGDLNNSGKGGPLNHTKGEELVQQGIGLMTQSCDKGEFEQCGRLGAMYDLGIVVQRDFGAAAHLSERACQGGEENGCVMFASLLLRGTGVAQDVARAAGLYEHACDVGDTIGCVALADQYIMGQGVPKDPEKARTLLSEPCRHGAQYACALLDKASTEMSNATQAEQTLQ
jgi:TPR repeat protein